MSREPARYLVKRFKSPFDGKYLWWGAVRKFDEDGNWWYAWFKCSEDWEEVIAWIQHREMIRNSP